MSLARGFFEGGAHAVVGSLWPLRDDEAAALFRAFYQRLARGETLSAALAAAQRERLAAGAPAAAWAGVVLLGDGEARPAHGRRRTLWPAAWSIAIAAALAFLLWRVRTRICRPRLFLG